MDLLLLALFTLSSSLHATLASSSPSQASNFTTINGQIYTPGLAIVDSPQPNTPEGGDFLQLALDVSGNGHLPFSPSSSPLAPGNTTPTGFFNITAFLYSYATTLNLTISNGTSQGWTNGCNATVGPSSGNGQVASSPNAGCVPILLQEPGSTVKHVDFLWPGCLVGDGSGTGSGGADGNARGSYNISIHQSFRLNGTNYYTIFDLPIEVSNSIPETTSSSGARLPCSALTNQLLSPAQQAKSQSPLPQGVLPWVNGSGVQGGSGGNGSTGTGTASVGSRVRVEDMVGWIGVWAGWTGVWAGLWIVMGV